MSNGLRSYAAIPINARVLEQRLVEPMAVSDRVTRYLAYLRDEWRRAKRPEQRQAIEREATSLKAQR